MEANQITQSVGLRADRRSGISTGKVLAMDLKKGFNSEIAGVSELLNAKRKQFKIPAKDLKVTSARKTIAAAIKERELTTAEEGLAANNPKLTKWTENEREYLALLQLQKSELKDLTALLREKDRLAAEKRNVNARYKQSVQAEQEKSNIRLGEVKERLRLKEEARQARVAAESVEKQSKALGAASGATKKMGGIMGKVTGIFQRFARVLAFRLYRMAAQKVIQMAVEGVQALVNWDYQFGNNTSGAVQTMTELKSTIDLVTRSLGAMAMPILQVVMPVFRALAKVVIWVANAINMAIRSFQGYGTYMKAVYKEVSAVTDETKNASAAAKELERVLFGFDDLNILPDENGRKGYGGLGALDGALPDYEEVEIPAKVKLIFEREPGNIMDFIGTAWEGVTGFFEGLTAEDGLFSDDPFGALKRAWEQFKQDMSDNWETLKENLHLVEIKDWIVEAWGNIKTAFVEGWNGVKQLPVLGDFAKVLEDIFSGRVFTKEYWTEIWEGFKKDVDSVIQFIKDKWDAFKTWIKTKIVDPIGGFFTALWESVKTIVHYVTHPSMWGTDLSGELRKIWDEAFAVTEEGVGETQEYLNNHPLAPDMTMPRVDMHGVEQGITDGNMWLVNNPLRTRTTNPYVDLGTYKQGISDGNKWAQANPVITMVKQPQLFLSGLIHDIATANGTLSPIDIKTNILTNGLGSAIGSMLYQSQMALNNNPLNITTKIGNTVNGILNPLNLISGVAGYISGIFRGSYASGGMVPNKGQLIQVNERGPEVVANMGSHTGIMNVNQMQEAVASGNIDVVNAVYTMANMIVNAVNAKDLDVYMDSEKVGQSVTNYQNNQTRRGVAY